jgi:hypothetical protein
VVEIFCPGLDFSTCILCTGHHQGYPKKYHHQYKNDHKTFEIRHRRSPEELVVHKHWRRAENLALQAFILQVAVCLAKSLPARFVRFGGLTIFHLFGRAALDFPAALLAIGRFELLMVNSFCLPARVKTAQNIDQACHNQKRERDAKQNPYENN